MDSAELSDLDSSASAWSPMSSLDDQENLHDLDTQRGGSESGSPPIMHRRTSKNPVKRVQQRTAANHRERKRMKTINEAFEGLRERIPLASGDRKLSKVDTLRLAIRYINQLSDMVTACGDVDGQLTTTSEPDAAKVIIRCHGTGKVQHLNIILAIHTYSLRGTHVSFQALDHDLLDVQLINQMRMIDIHFDWEQVSIITFLNGRLEYPGRLVYGTTRDVTTS